MLWRFVKKHAVFITKIAPGSFGQAFFSAGELKNSGLFNLYMLDICCKLKAAGVFPGAAWGDAVNL
jgi:hypothetical protein